MKYFTLTLAVCVALCANIGEAQSFYTLLAFTGTGGSASGAYPQGSLTIVGTSLYGMTEAGGVYGNGNIFSVGENGANYQDLLSFTGDAGTASGAFPLGTLTFAGTRLYGMTSGIGIANYSGNIFSAGTGDTDYQNLVSFTGTGGAANGKSPIGSLTVGGATLFGVTPGGGPYVNQNGAGYGNVFAVAANGTNFQNVLSFTGTGGAASGDSPVGRLTLAGTTLYGMTYGGGGTYVSEYGTGYGNVFSVGTDGTNYQNLLSFTGSSGAAIGEWPTGSLTLGGTRLYGMTSSAGSNGAGNVFSVGTDGTGYQNLVSFTGTGGTATGDGPRGSLILCGTTLFGTTSNGGVNGEGNIFSVGTDGSDYQNLYNFAGSIDGGSPSGDLTLSGGTLFGMTVSGGYGYGTVFALTVPEPGALVLVGTATIALVSYRWQRRRREGRRSKSKCRNKIEVRSTNSR